MSFPTYFNCDVFIIAMFQWTIDLITPSHAADKFGLSNMETIITY